MNDKLAKKLYRDAVNKAKDEMSDELFLGFYRKGQLTSDDMSKDEWGIHLEAIKEMALDKSFGDCERAYAVGIQNVQTDIEDILKNWTIDVAALEVGSIFYTLKISDMRRYDFYQIFKWEVKGIRKYKTSMEGTRKIYEVHKKDYDSVCYGENDPEEDYYNDWCFTDEELIEQARDEDKFFIEQREHYQSTNENYLKEQEQYKGMFAALEGLDNED